MHTGFPALVAAAALLAGCASYTKDMGKANSAPVAIAQLRTAAGTDVGRATARQAKGGLRLTVDVTGMPPGEHGAHIHAVGRCDPTDFMTAGGHWNPGATKHGLLNPAGPHEGDLPNLIVGTDGRGTLGVTIKGATMASLLDSDGSAIIVHAARDDQTSDPSGNSGVRLACGVFGIN